MTTRMILLPAFGRRLLLGGAAVVLAASFAAGQQRDGQNRVRMTDVGDVTLKYHIQDDMAVIGTGNSGNPAVPAGTDGQLILPGEIDGFRVRRIDSFAFSGCSRLEEVVLPNRANGQLSLSHGLFSGCRSLRRVVFPERFSYASRGGHPGTTDDILHGCDALEEIVFLGGVPESSFMERLGVPLDNRLRFTETYAKQWKVYVADNGVTGWKVMGPSTDGGDGRPESPGDVKVDLALAEYASNEPSFAPLVKFAGNFCAFLKAYEAQYEKSCRELDGQLREQMAMNKDKYQALGDLDAVMAYEEALKTDQPIKTEVESLKALYAQRAAAEAAYRKERDKKLAKAAAVMRAKLDEIKMKETRAGNIAYATEVKAYGDRVAVLADALQRRMKASTSAEAEAPSGARAGGGKRTDGGIAKESAEMSNGPLVIP